MNKVVVAPPKIAYDNQQDFGQDFLLMLCEQVFTN